MYKSTTSTTHFQPQRAASCGIALGQGVHTGSGLRDASEASGGGNSPGAR